MHIRDKRAVGEQVKSGFRIVGFLLLTLMLVSVMMSSAAFLVGKNSNPGTGHRILGGAGLLAISVLMFFTARYWAKWFAAILAWAILRSVLRGPFTSGISGWWIAETLAVLIPLFALSVKPAWRRTPEKVETIGLIGAVLSMSFASVLASFIPSFIGVGVLGLARFMAWKKPGRRLSHSRAKILGPAPQ